MTFQYHFSKTSPSTDLHIRPKDLSQFPLPPKMRLRKRLKAAHTYTESQMMSKCKNQSHPGGQGPKGLHRGSSIERGQRTFIYTTRGEFTIVWTRFACRLCYGHGIHPEDDEIVPRVCQIIPSLGDFLRSSCRVILKPSAMRDLRLDLCDKGPVFL